MIIPLILLILCAVHFIKTINKSNSPLDYTVIHALVSGALILIGITLSIKLDLP